MGLVIKERRKMLGFTQKALAEKLNVSDKAVSKWERCESLPDVTVVPQIALALGISIDYLMTGADSTDSNGHNTDISLEHQDKNALSAAVAVAQQKINAGYTMAICILLGVLVINFFVRINAAESYITIVNDIYRPVIYSFVVMALYAGLSAWIRTKRVALKHSYRAETQGHLDETFAFTAVGCVLIMFGVDFAFNISPFMQNEGFILADIIVEKLGIDDSGYTVSKGRTMLIMEPVLYCAVVVISIIFAKKEQSFGRNVYVTAAICAVMCILHRLYITGIDVYICYKQLYMFTFWLKRPEVQAVLKNIKIFAVVYFAVLIVIIAAVTAICIKDKKQRIVQLVIAGSFAGYLFVNAFGVVNTDFKGLGNFWAKLNTASLAKSIMFAAACPHIVMIINGIVNKTE